MGWLRRPSTAPIRGEVARVASASEEVSDRARRAAATAQEVSAAADELVEGASCSELDRSGFASAGPSRPAADGPPAPPLAFALVRRAPWLNFGRGFLMGTADAVPGVSGGTIALLVGIYERLVHAVSTASAALGLALRGRVRPAIRRLGEIDWLLIGPLVAGILVAIVLLARVIEHMLEEWPVGMAAVFLGLVAASAYIAWGMIKRPAPVHVPIAIVTAVIAFLVLGVEGGEVTDPSLLVVFGAGAIAICAMILPGISGSFLLLMMGMYDYVIEAVNDRDLLVLAVFAAGCVTGLALFSSLLDWSLRHHHDVIVAALVGLMVGSLRVLWPWPEGVESSALHAPPAGGWIVPLLLAVVSAGIVIGLATAARRRAPATDRPESAPSR